MKLTIYLEYGCTAEAQIQLGLSSSSLNFIPSEENMHTFPLQPPINKYESSHNVFIVNASKCMFLFLMAYKVER